MTIRASVSPPCMTCRRPRLIAMTSIHITGPPHRRAPAAMTRTTTTTDPLATYLRPLSVINTAHTPPRPRLAPGLIWITVIALPPFRDERLPPWWRSRLQVARRVPRCPTYSIRCSRAKCPQRAPSPFIMDPFLECVRAFSRRPARATVIRGYITSRGRSLYKTQPQPKLAVPSAILTSRFKCRLVCSPKRGETSRRPRSVGR